MKIVHLRASNFYGGPERQLHQHAIRAGACGISVAVASFEEGGRVPEFLEVIAHDGIETFCFKVKNAYDPGAIGLLREHLAAHKVDILCTHDYRTQILGYMATRGRATRWVAFSRGATTENFKVKLYQKLAALVIRFADKIVAVSDSERRKLHRYGVREDKIAVVHNAIDTDLIGLVEKVDLRERFNFPHDSIICVSAGRFSREKGQIYLAKAALEAVRKNKRLRFLLFGDGPDLEEIKEYISQMDYQGKVICPGFEKNLLGCLKGADILVNPSLSEGLPNVVLEAMALRIPVIATSVGGVPELIKHGENGMLVSPGDDKSLSNAILKLVEFWPLHDKLIQSAFETIRDKFSFEGQLRGLMLVYQAALGRKAVTES